MKLPGVIRVVRFGLERTSYNEINRVISIGLKIKCLMRKDFRTYCSIMT
jgi:hypothetical protein